ncbi:unnamed protein product [Prorocentrum cordatum]|uniref:Uncharacterized protein n=1 Tax=Prorocentrum cordatum TaxID=2364126 RepID=A0ABN9PZJ2_9DINO|nr:unnamed protein product [Polarella glacialis]
MQKIAENRFSQAKKPQRTRLTWSALLWEAAERAVRPEVSKRRAKQALELATEDGQTPWAPRSGRCGAGSRLSARGKKRADHDHDVSRDPVDWWWVIGPSVIPASPRWFARMICPASSAARASASRPCRAWGTRAARQPRGLAELPPTDLVIFHPPTCRSSSPGQPEAPCKARCGTSASDKSAASCQPFERPARLLPIGPSGRPPRHPALPCFRCVDPPRRPRG